MCNNDMYRVSNSYLDISSFEFGVFIPFYHFKLAKESAFWREILDKPLQARKSHLLYGTYVYLCIVLQGMVEFGETLSIQNSAFYVPVKQKYFISICVNASVTHLVWSMVPILI